MIKDKDINDQIKRSGIKEAEVKTILVSDLPKKCKLTKTVEGSLHLIEFKDEAGTPLVCFAREDEGEAEALMAVYLKQRNK